MLSLTLFLAVGMMVLPNVLSICTNNITLKHLAPIGDVLVFCDHGREIKVKKLPDASFFIKVVNCNGNFNNFTLKALRSFQCADGLEHTVYPTINRNNLSSFSAAYAEISEWY